MPFSGEDASTPAPAGRPVCVLRLHDPLTRENWGGRATSLAFARLLEREAGRSIVSSIGAPHILKPLSSLDQPAEDGDSGFAVVDRLAAAIRSPTTDPLRAVHRAIADADQLVVNGEGDFILTERLTLVRTLAMMRAAAAMGKPVHLLNCILSEAPHPPRHRSLIVEQVGATLEQCETVLYRDPTSHALHRDLYGSTPAVWAPDALFAWASSARTDLAARDAFAPETEGLPIGVQRLLTSGQPYVVLSGTSRKHIDPQRFRRTVTALRDALAARGMQVVFAGSDSPDRRLGEALAGAGVPVVDPAVPLTAAARLLWNASALISGRYHPSILASLGGTPVLLMASNSHKTQSLRDVVHTGTAGDELPFFTGGPAGAERIMTSMQSALGSQRTRRTVRRSARENGRRAQRAVVDALTPAAHRPRRVLVD